MPLMNPISVRLAAIGVLALAKERTRPNRPRIPRPTPAPRSKGAAFLVDLDGGLAYELADRDCALDDAEFHR